MIPWKTPTEIAEKNASPAERRSHNHNNDSIDCGLGEQDRRGAEQTVVDRADDGHGTDTDSHGRHDKALDESRIAATPRLLLEPASKTLHTIFEIDSLTDDRTADKACEHAVRPDEHHCPIAADMQHFLDGPRQTEEYDSHSAGHHNRLLEALRYQPTTPQSQKAATNNP